VSVLFWDLCFSWLRFYCLCHCCVPDVASISISAGVPLVPVFFAGFPVFVGVPGVVSFLLLFSSLLLLVFLLLLSFLLLMASLLLLAPLQILASLYYRSWYLYVLYYTMRHIWAIGISDCHFFLLSNYLTIEYRTIGYRIKATIYRTIRY
jgi:hypothetical protein